MTQAHKTRIIIVNTKRLPKHVHDFLQVVFFYRESEAGDVDFWAVRKILRKKVSVQRRAHQDDRQRFPETSRHDVSCRIVWRPFMAKSDLVYWTIKSSRFSVSFRGISRLGSAFIFLHDSNLHISVFKLFVSTGEASKESV